MCGIAGFLGNGLNEVYSQDILQRMIFKLKHRGPDTQRTWTKMSDGIGLAHSRLSIFDLSKKASQPMLSSNGRFVLSFNGEIYNFKSLKKTLQKNGLELHLSSESDTEVLLKCIEYWGLKKTLHFIEGMYAISLWDNMSKNLYLCRDRMGEKPLYYSKIKDYFVFASELQCFNEFPFYNKEVDRDVISQFMRYSSIYAPKSIFKNVYKLMPAHILCINRNQLTPKISSYWNLPKIAENAKKNLLLTSENIIAQTLEKKLSEAINAQMCADVPVGAFLSGGIDSSLIVALMQKQATKPVKTYALGYENALCNEADYAKEVARHLKTDHTSLILKEIDVLNFLPNIFDVYDEPFADSSQIPTYFVSKLARKDVKVVLTGDGGDEIFAGYNRYIMTDILWTHLNLIPSSIRTILSKAICLLPPSKINFLFSLLSKILPKKFSLINPGEKIHRISPAISSKNLTELYNNLTSVWHKPSSLVIGSKEILISNELKKIESITSLKHFEKFMLFDSLGYLPNDILTKVDRASMSNSLESRAPFLNHKIIEYSWKIPHTYKINKGISKWILRKILYQHIPQKLIDRPKMGFGIPIEFWLKGPLREWAQELLNPNKIKQQGYLNEKLVSNIWQKYLSGESKWYWRLWNILMFQLWLESNR